jgi:hypothetical protein
MQFLSKNYQLFQCFNNFDVISCVCNLRNMHAHPGCLCPTYFSNAACLSSRRELASEPAHGGRQPDDDDAEQPAAGHQLHDPGGRREPTWRGRVERRAAGAHERREAEPQSAGGGGGGAHFFAAAGLVDSAPGGHVARTTARLLHWTQRVDQVTNK